MSAYKLGTPEAQVITMAHEMVGLGYYVRNVMTREGMIYHIREMTPRLLALRLADTKDKWPELTYQQACAWEERVLHDAIAVQVRRKLKAGDRAPWPWPPSAEGKPSPQGPSDPLMSPEDNEVDL